MANNLGTTLNSPLYDLVIWDLSKLRDGSLGEFDAALKSDLASQDICDIIRHTIGVRVSARTMDRWKAARKKQ